MTYSYFCHILINFSDPETTSDFSPNFKYFSPLRRRADDIEEESSSDADGSEEESSSDEDSSDNEETSSGADGSDNEEESSSESSGADDSDNEENSSCNEEEPSSNAAGCDNAEESSSESSDESSPKSTSESVGQAEVTFNVKDGNLNSFKPDTENLQNMEQLKHRSEAIGSGGNNSNKSVSYLTETPLVSCPKGEGYNNSCPIRLKEADCMEYRCMYCGAGGSSQVWFSIHCQLLHRDVLESFSGDLQSVVETTVASTPKKTDLTIEQVDNLNKHTSDQNKDTRKIDETRANEKCASNERARSVSGGTEDIISKHKSSNTKQHIDERKGQLCYFDGEQHSEKLIQEGVKNKG